MQNSPGDCGPFAIAFAATLASGTQPGQCYYDQTQLRKHLEKCLINDCMLPFPVKRVRRNYTKIKLKKTVPLYCTCRLPALSCTMVQCDHCKQWYHANICIAVPRHVMHSKKKWFCGVCG